MLTGGGSVLRQGEAPPVGALPCALTAEQAQTLARLEPLVPGTPVPPEFAGELDAFSHLLNGGSTTHTVSWPDGSVGFLTFQAHDDRAARLLGVYAIARRLLEARLMAWAAGSLQ